MADTLRTVTMDKELNLLIVEDSETDAELMVMRLENAGFKLDWQRVETMQAFLDALSTKIDIILSDWSLPQFGGLAALRLLKEKNLDIPFIIISGSIGEEAALDALRMGAYDYLLKDRPDRLGQAVRNALEQKQLRDQHRKAEEALAESEAELRALFASMEDVVLVLDREGVYRKIAPTNPGLLVRPREELIGAKLFDFFPEEQTNRYLRIIAEVLESGDSQRIEYELEIEGITKWFETTISRMTNELVVWVARDSTARKQSEHDLVESEERYRALFTNNQSVILITDPQSLLIQDVNASAVNYYGYSMKEFRGMSIGAINTTSEEDLRENLALSVARKKSVFQFCHRLKNGQIRDVEVFSGPIPLNERTLIYSIVNDISERKLFENSLKDYTLQQERIIALGSELSATVDLDVIYPTVERHLRPMIGYKTFAISMLRGERLTARYVCDEGRVGEVNDLADLPYGKDSADCGRVKAIMTGEPVILEQVNLKHNDCCGLICNSSDKIQSAMFIPLVAEGRVIGSMDFFSAIPGYYRDVETKWMFIVANLVGLNILNSLSFTNAQKRLAELSALHAIDTVVTSSHDQQETFDVLLQETVGQLGVDAAAILLLDEETQTLQYAHRYGFARPEGLQDQFGLDDCLAGWVARKAEIVQHFDLKEIEPKLVNNLGCDEERFAAYIGAPLMLEGKVIGVLELLHRSVIQPDEGWLRFLELITGQAAIAVSHLELIRTIQSANLELLQAYDATIEGWSQAMDLRDKETEGHTQRVMNLTLELAARMGLSSDEMVQFKRGALLHDIGKLGVPDRILYKPGPLTEDEWLIMKQHPVFAYQMLVSIDYLKPALDIPYCHHEKWDGSGYPRGLKSEQIPIAARIFAVVDVWDALTSDRPYRPAWTHEATLAYIRDESGKYFDPRIVPIFMELMRDLDKTSG